MNTSNNNKPLLSFCYPFITIACIFSCTICTLVMIWGVYAMRIDMKEMREMIKVESSMKRETSTTAPMNMADPMSMSMRDMGKMLEGKTGDELDRAFLEGMIPHHQGAVDMAKYLINAKHPELRKMGEDIISAQDKEINEMKSWQKEWGYTSTSENPQESMMREHCKTMPTMVGCENYR